MPRNRTARKRHYRKMPEVVARSPEALKRALTLHQTGNLLEAAAIYKAVLASKPDHYDCLHLLGIVAYQRGDHGEAIRLIDKALAVKPDFANAYNTRGNVLKEMEELNKALESYNTAVLINPNHFDALHNIGSTLQHLQRFHEAVASYDRALVKHPDHPKTLSARGYCLYKLGRLDESLVSLDKALAIIPNDSEGYEHRGNANYDAFGYLDEASARYDRAFALIIRGNILSETGRFDEALASYDKAQVTCRRTVGLRHDFPEAWTGLSYALIALERWADAESACHNALASQPDCPMAWNNLAHVLIALDRWDEAEYSCRKALALQPDYTGAWLNLCHTLIRLQRWDEAEEACRMAVTLNPDLSEAWRYLARVLRGQGRSVEAAEVACCGSILLSPDHADSSIAEANLLRLQEAVDKMVFEATSGDSQFILSQDYIRALHHVAMNRLSKHPGEYRAGPVFIGNLHILPPNWSEIPALMGDLCGYVNDNWINRDSIHLSAFVLWRLALIHPFPDGNGRIARAVSSAIFCIKRRGFPDGKKNIIAHICSIDRDGYFACLNHAHQTFSQNQNVDEAIEPVEQWLSSMLAAQLSKYARNDQPS